MNDVILRQIRKANIVKTGKFKLRSGAYSDYYIDIRKLYGDPSLLLNISKEIKKILSSNVNCIAGSGYGGLPLASAVSLVARKNFIAVRNEKKDHGVSKAVEGYVPMKKDRIVIVDDIFTTGSSLLDTIKQLSKTGSKVVGAIVIVKRGKIGKFPVPIRYLFEADKILN